MVFDTQAPEAPQAMLEVRRNQYAGESEPQLGQLVGPRNEEVPEELEKAARYWLRAQQHPH